MGDIRRQSALASDSTSNRCGLATGASPQYTSILFGIVAKFVCCHCAYRSMVSMYEKTVGCVYEKIINIVHGLYRIHAFANGLRNVLENF